MHRQREWKHSDPPVCSPKRFPSQQPSGPSALLMSRSCSNWTQAAFCAGSGSGSTGSSFTRTGWASRKTNPLLACRPAPCPDSSTDRKRPAHESSISSVCSASPMCHARASESEVPNEGLWKRGLEGVRVWRLDRCEIVSSTIPAASSVGRGCQRSSLLRSLPLGHSCPETSECGCQIRSSRVCVVEKGANFSRLKSVPRVAVFGAKRRPRYFELSLPEPDSSS